VVQPLLCRTVARRGDRAGRYRGQVAPASSDDAPAGDA
jgi:hypothetical protein